MLNQEKAFPKILPQSWKKINTVVLNIIVCWSIDLSLNQTTRQIIKNSPETKSTKMYVDRCVKIRFCMRIINTCNSLSPVQGGWGGHSDCRHPRWESPLIYKIPLSRSLLRSPRLLVSSLCPPPHLPHSVCVSLHECWTIWDADASVYPENTAEKEKQSNE